MNVFAVVGSSFQQVGGACPDGWLVMSEERPSPDHVAQADGLWGIPMPSLEALQASERAWRDAELASLVWLRDRHRDQLEIGAVATLTAEQFAELLVYMQALRDWPQTPEFPESSARPVAPPWIADQTP